MTIANFSPAYPGPIYTQSGHIGGHSMGMSLRDWFAGQAMMKGIIYSDWDTSIKWRAQCAYEMADAMLAARGDK